MSLFSLTKSAPIYKNSKYLIALHTCLNESSIRKTITAMRQYRLCIILNEISLRFTCGPMMMIIMWSKVTNSLYPSEPQMSDTENKHTCRSKYSQENSWNEQDCICLYLAANKKKKFKMYLLRDTTIWGNPYMNDSRCVFENKNTKTI